MSGPAVTFIIPTHNNKDVIGRCLESIRNQTAGDWECVVIDDASTDGTPEFVAENMPWVRVIRQRESCGPSLNRNVAAAQSHARYLAFLDSDVELHSEWLARMVEVLEREPQAGIGGCKLLLAARPSTVNAFGGAIGRLGITWNAHEWEDAATVTRREYALWASSAAMLMRRPLFEQLGGFDNTYFYGCEDTDIGWRANLSGASVVCIPEAIAWHRTSETIVRRADAMAFHAYKNAIRCIIKNYGALRLPVKLTVYFAYSVTDVLLRGNKKAKVRAWWWNLVSLRDTLRLRARIQKSRMVSDAQLRALFSSRLFPPVRLKDRRRYSGLEAASAPERKPNA